MFLIGWEQVVYLLEDYDRWFFFPMLLKCHHVFHLVLKFEIVANKLNDKDLACLQSSKMTNETNELDKELVNKEL
jgi:hypothetical protein